MNYTHIYMVHTEHIHYTSYHTHKMYIPDPAEKLGSGGLAVLVLKVWNI